MTQEDIGVLIFAVFFGYVLFVFYCMGAGKMHAFLDETNAPCATLLAAIWPVTLCVSIVLAIALMPFAMWDEVRRGR
jgi:hypothetical protein